MEDDTQREDIRGPGGQSEQIDGLIAGRSGCFKKMKVLGFELSQPSEVLSLGIL